MPFYKVPPSTRPTSDLQQRSSLTNRLLDDDRLGSPRLHAAPSDRRDVEDGQGEERPSDLMEMTEADQDTELFKMRSTCTLEQGVVQQQAGAECLDLRQERDTKNLHKSECVHQLKGAIDRELSDQKQPEDCKHETDLSPTELHFVLSKQNGSSAATFSSAEGLERRYAHPGESRIVREFYEQSQREAELRDHWKEMGMIVDEDTSHTKTPFTLPQPLADEEYSAGLSKRSVISASAAVVKMEHGSGKNSFRGIVSRIVAAKSKPPADVKAGLFPVLCQKVTPFDYPSLNLDGKLLYFVPAEETPIEREIRVIEEREKALREERGIVSKQTVELVSTGRHEHDVEAQGEHKASPNKPVLPSTQQQEKKTLKKLVTCIMQMEINQAKQRELELKMQRRSQMIELDVEDRTKKYQEIQPCTTGMSYFDLNTNDGHEFVAVEENHEVKDGPQISSLQLSFHKDLTTSSDAKMIHGSDKIVRRCFQKFAQKVKHVDFALSPAEACREGIE